jgi:hypothetical protein
MKHPETAQLARAAFQASGAKTYPEFLRLFDGAIATRTFADWMAGNKPAQPIAQLVLREVIAGWRPGNAGK